jgi:DNA-binding NtrC family response regulator
MAEKPMIFAVDDEAETVDMITRTLSDEYDVKGFACAQAAIDAAAVCSPVCVIADFRLPDVNGVDMLARMRNNGTRCAGLIITGYAAEGESALAGHSEVAFRVLEKPWRPEDLRAQARMAISTFRMAASTARLAEHNANKPDRPKR